MNSTTPYALAGTDRPSAVDAWAYVALLVIASIGYPLSGALTTLLAPGSQVFSFGFRGVVVALSAVIFFKAMFEGRLSTIPVILILFFSAATARLFYDNFVSFAIDADKAGQYFIGTVLPPALSLCACRRNFDARKLAPFVFGYNAPVCFLVGYINFFDLGGDADLTKETGRLFFEALNPTLIAFSGMFVIVSGFILWSKANLLAKGGILIAAAMGLQLMSLAISRGPWIALILSLGFILSAKRNYYLPLIIAVVAFFALPIFSAAFFDPFSIFGRLATSGIDESSQERIFAMEQAYRAMIDNPIFGLAYVDPVTGFYPHNLVLESGLALGVAGAAAMVFIQINLLKKLTGLIAQEDLMLGVFVVSVITAAYLSGSIWQSADFWCAAALVMSLNSVRKPAALRA
jgi:O-antigen ligase